MNHMHTIYLVISIAFGVLGAILLGGALLIRRAGVAASGTWFATAIASFAMALVTNLLAG